MTTDVGCVGVFVTSASIFGEVGTTVGFREDRGEEWEKEEKIKGHLLIYRFVMIYVLNKVRINNWDVYFYFYCVLWDYRVIILLIRVYIIVYYFSLC